MTGAEQAPAGSEVEATTPAYRAHLDHLMACDECALLGIRCEVGAELYQAYTDALRST